MQIPTLPSMTYVDFAEAVYTSRAQVIVLKAIEATVRIAMWNVSSPNQMSI